MSEEEFIWTKKGSKWTCKVLRKVVGVIYVENFPKEGLEYFGYVGRSFETGKSLGSDYSLDNMKARIESEMDV